MSKQAPKRSGWNLDNILKFLGIAWSIVFFIGGVVFWAGGEYDKWERVKDAVLNSNTSSPAALSERINGLEATINNTDSEAALLEKINSLQDTIDNPNSELNRRISDSDGDLLEKINSLKDTIDNPDSELNRKISDLAFDKSDLNLSIGETEQTFNSRWVVSDSRCELKCPAGFVLKEVGHLFSVEEVIGELGREN